MATTPAQPAHESLAAAPRTAEELDETVETTTTGGWIALVAIALLVAGGLAWSLIAHLPQQTVATGVVDQRDVVTYLPAGDAVRYTPGDTVSVALQDLAAGSTRTVRAAVSAVSDVPSSIEAMRATRFPEDLARELLDAADGVAYRVDLALPDPLSGPGRPARGQLVEVTNTYDDPHPIELLLGRTG